MLIKLYWFLCNIKMKYIDFEYFFCDSPQDAQVGFQDPATPLMEGIIDLHHDLVVILIIVIVMITYLGYFVIREFRWNPWINLKITVWTNTKTYYFKVRHMIEDTHNTSLEIIWTIIPALMLLIIGVPSISLLYAADEIVQPTVTVKVIGNQWFWRYEYSIDSYLIYADENDKDKTLDSLDMGNLDVFDLSYEFAFDNYMLSEDDLELGYLRLLNTDRAVLLPIRTYVRLLVTSLDVLHSWAVPSLGVKLDACPGRLNQTSLFIRRPGLFFGQCSEICGVNHAFMPIMVRGTTLNEFFYNIFKKLKPTFVEQINVKK